MIGIYIGLAAICGLALGYLLAKKIEKTNFNLYLAQAKAKAKAIEHEAAQVLKDANNVIFNTQANLHERFKKRNDNLLKDYEKKLKNLSKKEKNLELWDRELGKISDEQEKKFLNITTLFAQGEALKENYQEKLDEVVRVLEHSAGLTANEAKEIILSKTEENCRSEIAHIVRKYEEDAKAKAKQRANYIIAQATSRFVGEYVTERLINVISLKSDDIKGRIIGKEGRNLKALEMTLGVDIIIDDTPNTIVVSCFNIYRRAVATKTLELLIEDGRIHPARIESLYEKVCKDFENSILEEGKNIIMDLGLSKMSNEITCLVGKLRYRASYGQNALVHSIEVAKLAAAIASECGGDIKLAKRAGLLHDIGKALTQDYEGSHVDLGAQVCKRHNEHPVVINAIYAHHGHEEATSIEAAAVCTADTLSAARPGARREVLELFLNRVNDIEEIAKSKVGVKTAFALNAGREVRVIANARLVNDDEAVLLAKEIARDIEENVQYPGEIKVHIIREVRAVSMAK